jgi:hypothetical protein
MNYLKINHIRACPLTTLIGIIFLLTGCNDSSVLTKSSELIVIPKGELKIESEKLNRFQMMNNPIAVIDTHTGEVWKATGPMGGPYHFVRICYKLNEAGLAPIPSKLWNSTDYASFKQECSGK